MPSEVTWDWADIWILAMARLVPIGVELNPDDVVKLAFNDRTLVENRDDDGITFSWKTTEEAREIANPRIISPTVPKPTVSKVEGRYMKLACLLFLKLAPNGIRLSTGDAQLIPDGKFIFEDGIEYKWLSLAEGIALRRRERDNEGRDKIVSKGGFS